MHYSQTSWKTHRPKSRPRTPQPRAQTSAKSKTTFPTFEEMNVAKQDPPWNKGTPARRVATPALNENEGKEVTEAANAAQPVVPPQASLQEQLLKRQNDFKDQMTPDLRLAMEQFSKGMDNNGPQLTHAHLNRAKQARLALTKAKGKVTQLDAQWAQFLTVLKDNFKTQHASYQEKRGEALQQVAQKRKRWMECQEDIQRATQPGAPLLPEPPEELDVDNMETMLPWDDPQFAAAENLASDEEELKDAAAEPRQESPAMTPFRCGDQHPTKVPRLSPQNPP